MSPSRGIKALAAVISDFDSGYPQAALELTEGYANGLKEKLLSGELDIILTALTGRIPDNSEAIPLQEEELVLAVPSFHPAVHHDTHRLDELPYADLGDFRDSIFVMPDVNSSLYTLVVSAFENAGFHPRFSATTPNTAMQVAMIQSGTRIGLLPAHYLRHNEGIAFFRLHRSPKMVSTFLYRSDHALSEPERFLIYLLIKHNMSSSIDGAALWCERSREILEEFDTMSRKVGSEGVL